MRLLRISPSLYHIFRSGYPVYLPTQYDFIKYFMNAEYVLTDSFHATIFSIIFDKKFIDILPLNKTGTRIESILNLFEIDNRILLNFDDMTLIDNEIDYKNVHNIWKHERKKSLKLFKDAIEN